MIGLNDWGSSGPRRVSGLGPEEVDAVAAPALTVGAELPVVVGWFSLISPESVSEEETAGELAPTGAVEPVEAPLLLAKLAPAELLASPIVGLPAAAGVAPTAPPPSEEDHPVEDALPRGSLNTLLALSKFCPSAGTGIGVASAKESVLPNEVVEDPPATAAGVPASAGAESLKPTGVSTPERHTLLRLAT
jgi:hypothetical protein